MTQVASGPPRQKRGKMLRSKKHREFVSHHACAVCMGTLIWSSVTFSQACHVNYLGASHGRPRGKSEKVDDVWVVPMCAHHHIDQSAKGQSGIGEERWWFRTTVDPLHICLELARNSPDPKVREFAERLKE